MRKLFAVAIESLARKDPRLVFLTGDLGFHAFESLSKTLSQRFINAGVAEANMVDVASGLSYLGEHPWVFSITPFLTLKTVEQLRNSACFLNLPVKLVGNGGGYGYGILGATHHSLEDIAILSALPNMKIYSPAFTEDVPLIVNKMHRERGPGYLRLNLAQPQEISLPRYQGLRRIKKGNKVSLLVLGHLIHNALPVCQKFPQQVDLWSLTEIPFTLSTAFLDSLKKTQRLIVVEEHRTEGGVGEKLMSRLLQKKIRLKQIIHLSAKGYPSHLYGSQKFHWRENDLDERGIFKAVNKMCRLT